MARVDFVARFPAFADCRPRRASGASASASGTAPAAGAGDGSQCAAEASTSGRGDEAPLHRRRHSNGTAAALNNAALLQMQQPRQPRGRQRKQLGVSRQGKSGWAPAPRQSSAVRSSRAAVLRPSDGVAKESDTLLETAQPSVARSGVAAGTVAAAADAHSDKHVAATADTLPFASSSAAPPAVAGSSGDDSVAATSSGRDWRSESPRPVHLMRRRSRGNADDAAAPAGLNEPHVGTVVDSRRPEFDIYSIGVPAQQPRQQRARAGARSAGTPARPATAPAAHASGASTSGSGSTPSNGATANGHAFVANGHGHALDSGGMDAHSASNPADGALHAPGSHALAQSSGGDVLIVVEPTLAAEGELAPSSAGPTAPPARALVNS